MDTTNVQANENADYGQLFRVSLRGFNREDVTDYIGRMARDRRRDAERYGAHIRAIEEERAAAVQELESLRAEAETMRTSLAEAGSGGESLKTELADLRAENEELRARVAELEDRPDQAADMGEELDRARRSSDEKTGEITRLSAVLDVLEQENARLAQELETVRERAAAPAQEGGAELINRVRARNAAAPQAVTPPAVPAQEREIEAMQERIERARRRVQEDIAECSLLYDEMHRNIERLEAILRNLVD